MTLDQVRVETNLSRQTIIRAEQGCYADPPPRLLNYWLRRYPDEDRGMVIIQYRRFQRDIRQHHYGALIEIAFNSLWSTDFPGPVGKHPFIWWREYTGLNKAQVAKFFCVHPAVISRFENQPHLVKSLPEQLVSALLEAGYKQSTLDLIQAWYDSYLQYLNDKVKITLPVPA